MESSTTNTTFENATSSPRDFSEYSTEYSNLQTTVNFIGRYYIWIIFAFGFPGNLISFFVIMRMSRHRISTPLFYVGSLAVVDNIAIIVKIIENQLRSNKVFQEAPTCKILFFLGFTLAAYPNWILIVMSAERFTAVRFPMKVSLIWPLKRAVIIISLVLLFLCLVHFHIFFSVTSTDGACGMNPEFASFFVPWWFLISSFIYSVIPAVVLAIFNILIIRVLRRSTIQRQNMLSGTDQSVSESRRQERQITIMLVTLAVVFVLLTIPRCIYVLLVSYWKPEDKLGKMRKDFFNKVTSAIADSNHALNFYLYFVSAKRFRKYVKEIIYSVVSCVQRYYEAANGITLTSDLPVTDSST